MSNIPGFIAGNLPITEKLRAEFQAKHEKLKSRTLLFGEPGGSYLSFQVGELASDVNLSEFTTVILDPALAFGELGALWQLHYYNAIVTRLGELYHWVEDGHTAIIVLRNIGRIAVAGDSIQYTLDHFPLFNLIHYIEMSGTQIEYRGPQTAELFFEDWIALLRYDLIISSPNLKPLLRVNRKSKGPDQLIGGIVKNGLGRIIFVPQFNADPRSPKNMGYLAALAELPDLIQEAPEQLPQWAASFQIADEVQAHDNITALRAQISEIENAIRTEEEKISQVGRLKALFVGSGDAFVAAVKDGLVELGLRVIDGPHPRADLLALDDARGLLAIEVKGLDGSAKEKNVTQVDRWMAEVRDTFASSEEELKSDSDIKLYADKLAELGIQLPTEQAPNIKGLMAIGTFRKVPLDKRVEADFPDPVVRAAARSGVCAVTGLQLLLMVLQARLDPAFKVKFVEQLFATSGQIALEVTWRDFLTSR